jgi:hypothetical protein
MNAADTSAIALVLACQAPSPVLSFDMDAEHQRGVQANLPGELLPRFWAIQFFRMNAWASDIAINNQITYAGRSIL